MMIPHRVRSLSASTQPQVRSNDTPGLYYGLYYDLYYGLYYDYDFYFDLYDDLYYV